MATYFETFGLGRCAICGGGIFMDEEIYLVENKPACDGCVKGKFQANDYFEEEYMRKKQEEAKCLSK